jgi:hypothetical protein
MGNTFLQAACLLPRQEGAQTKRRVRRALDLPYDTAIAK